nr:unnamed protein product [Callosobruchus analis]
MIISTAEWAADKKGLSNTSSRPVTG